jgi:hypothetical protein
MTSPVPEPLRTPESDLAAEWETRVDALWKVSDTLAPADLVRGIDALAGERPGDDPVALFERACARDTAGRESEAEPLYRAALASGALSACRHARASIQLASTLRHLGRFEESEQLLRAQLERCRTEGPQAALHDETRAILAFTWLAQGKAVAAACLALETLAPHLSRYNRSTAANARAHAKNHAERGTWE